MTLGTYKMGRDIRQLGRVAAVAFGWFYFATFCAIDSRWCWTASFIPGSGRPGADRQDPAQSGGVDRLGKFLLDLIPSNISSWQQQKLPPTLVFSVLFGVRSPASARRPDRSSTCWKQSGAMFRLTRWIIALSPLRNPRDHGVPVRDARLCAVLGLAKLIGLMYLGLAIEIRIFS